MVTTLAQMSKEELREMIETAVATALEQKLLEILGDRDEGLEIREVIRERLLRQKQEVASGERCWSFQDVVLSLDLE